MQSKSRAVFTLLFSLLLFTPVLAQSHRNAELAVDAHPVKTRPQAQTSTVVVTATVGSRRVRYACLGEVHETRLQVFSHDGAQVFDSGFRLGNLIDWQLTDQQGARLTNGSYLYLVTVKDFSDRMTQKYGAAVLEEDEVYLEQAGRDELSQPQAAALESQRQAEQLSPVDRIGAGATSRIDVITSAGDAPSKGTEAAGTDKNSVAPTGTANATGSGSQNYVPKWTDGSGTLGDSSLFEAASGRIGLGTTNPGARLHVVGVPGVTGASTFQLDAAVQFANWTGVYPAFEVLNTNQTDNNVTLFQFSDAPSGASHAGMGAVSTSHVNKFGNLFFYTKGADGYQIRMGVYSGNVGIGTTTPGQKLEVAGSAKVTGDMIVTGNAVVSGNIAAKYQDVAEWVPASRELAPGTVVILDATRTNAVAASGRAYDTHIAGVVSAQPGVILGEGGTGKVLVATTGRVKVKVDASRAPIKIGDLLVTSGKEGTAMRSRPIRAGRALIHRPGTIIGKALEPLARGEAEILVLLSLQ